MKTRYSSESVMRYFKELCAIPHGSYHVDAISDYLVDFAKKHNLSVHQDELKNVIIKKDATSGYENEPGIILQGHMDMVAVCDDPAKKDMEKEGLDLVEEEGYLYAKGTSLGGDDGIAIAYALAILESNEIPHPALEVIITVNEEVGMDGAKGIDLSDIRGRRLLNIDSEEEGILTVSCAGGVRVHTSLEGLIEPFTAPVVFLSLDGLKGGHSGSEIHKGRANGAHLLADILLHILDDGYDLRLISMSAGEKDNAIPNSGSAEFAVTNLGDPEEFISYVESYNDELLKKYEGIEDEIRITIGVSLPEEGSGYSADDTEDFLEFIEDEPDGVIAICADMDLVETSLNLGIMKLDAEGLFCVFALRSSVASKLEELKERVAKIADNYDGESEFHGDYPAWEYKKESPFREKMVEIYRGLYGEDPKVEGIHAGLECGFFVNKIPDLEAVSIGPNILDIHTTKEKLDLQSTDRVWDYICAVLSEK